MVLWIILLILFLFFMLILVSPLDLEANSSKKNICASWLYFVKVCLVLDIDNPEFIIRVGPYRKRNSLLDISDKKGKKPKKETKKEKKRKKKKKKNKLKLIKYMFYLSKDALSSFKIKKMLVMVDTGNPMINGLLVAPFSQINYMSGGKTEFYVNWTGQNKTIIKFRNRLIIIVFIALKHIRVFFK